MCVCVCVCVCVRVHVGACESVYVLAHVRMFVIMRMREGARM